MVKYINFGSFLYIKSMNKHTIYCTEEQTRKALELGAPIDIQYNKIDCQQIVPILSIKKESVLYNYFIPTAEEMLGWLAEKKIEIDIIKGNDSYGFNLYFGQKFTKSLIVYNTRKEVILAAIDAALDYLITQNNKTIGYAISILQAIQEGKTIEYLVKEPLYGKHWATLKSDDTHNILRILGESVKWRIKS